MSDPIDGPGGSAIALDDKWTRERGRVVINGAQVIARILLDQAARDRRSGLRTAGYITGYRGSPLGNVDTTLWSIASRLREAEIIFHPGLNEDLAATAVRGTQQLDSVAGPRFDGVFAAWYGKGPGVDRSGDALKHGNHAGSHRHGGVLVFYGDDHAGKSSTVSHQSEQAVAASHIPSLYPADVAEMLTFGLLGFAMSRFSGSWVAIKCVNEVAEQTATVDLDPADGEPVLPPVERAADVHIRRGAFNPLGEEQIVIEQRLPLVQAFVRANGIDRTIIEARSPALGIVTAGKSYWDVRSALALLGLDDGRAAAAGISLYKVGCIWPLEPTGLVEFARGKRALLVVEEKQSFIEQQAAEILINRPDRALLLGKRDEDGAPLFSSSLPLDPRAIARAIAGRLEWLGRPLDTALDALNVDSPALLPSGAPSRAPYFCSGCPHNRSTRIPEGSISMTGIGCHTMVNFVNPDLALLPTQMGGEGANWIGLAPFTETPHIFQNMGDGTYYHSGLLAIRAAVAAGVNITYKILYNDAVAMTGGQPVDGPISVADIVRQVRDEGVQRIVVLSEDLSRHRGNREFPAGVTIGHRDTLESVQRELRETRGCTVLVYDQVCAAEKRRRRKRGTLPEATRRLFISKEVCEGCGDCSAQSTCVSLIPVDTELGRKRAIDQSSCNTDYSCLNGFCPSFITIRGASLRKPDTARPDESISASLPEARRTPLGDGFNLMVAGIGGTGVVTVGSLIGMAAHIEGKAMSLFDMTGLSQKNGAVYSHVRIAEEPRDIRSQRIGHGESDLVLAFDLVAASATECADTIGIERTRVIANAEVSPTIAFQFDRDFALDPSVLLSRLHNACRADAVLAVDASGLALALFGDTMAANLFLVGIAAQNGLLPVAVASIERAVEINGVAVALNLRALALGRLFVVDPARVLASCSRAGRPAPLNSLSALIEHRVAHLRAYQDDRLALRYRRLVERVRERESVIAPGSDALAGAVAKTYARLLTYKDEYEVARLLTLPALRDEIARTFSDGARIAFNLAPPVLAGRQVDGRPGKREFGPWLVPVLRMLARLRRLRGSWLDPFGRTKERRMERALIASFEQCVERVLAGLNEGNLDAAESLLSLASDIRGFGPVKAASVSLYRDRAAVAEEKFWAADATAPSRRAPDLQDDRAVHSIAAAL